jgi:hypothetical protein
MILFSRYGVEIEIPGSFVREVNFFIDKLASLSLFGFKMISANKVTRKVKKSKEFFVKEVMKTPF